MTEPQRKGPPPKPDKAAQHRRRNTIQCRKYREAHREAYNAYQREYMRKWRAARKQAAGRKIVADALAQALGVADER